jgi:hypothetical protein
MNAKAVASLLGLFIVFLGFSCKNDRDDAAIRISKISHTSSVNSNVHEYSFSYNDKGLLTAYNVLKTTSSGGVSSKTQTTLLYDANNQLSFIKFADLHTEWNAWTAAFTYGSKSKPASANVTFPDDDARVQWTFYYDDKGRINRIDTQADPNYPTTARTFDFDGAGNIIKQYERNVLPDGELSGSYAVTEIKYDNKKSPFYKLGSPLLMLYNNTPYFGLQSYISYLSPNNPVYMEARDYRNNYGEEVKRYEYGYKYNEKGYPEQITTGLTTMQLEYVVK